MSALSAAVDQLVAADAAHVEELRARVLAYCAEHDDALLRTSVAAHLTGSALVVDPADHRFVLLLHRKLGRWLQPGGHADGDGDLAAVALKEAWEETALDGLAVVTPAIDVDVHEVRPPGEQPHLHLDVRFLVLARPGAAAAGPPPGNHESRAIRWCTPADLDALDADPSTRRLVERGLQGLAGPG